MQDDDPAYATLQARVDRGSGYVEEQSRLLATGLYDYTSGDRALDLLTANNSAVGQTIGAGKMAVGVGERSRNLVLALAGDAVGAQTVSEAAASSYADAGEFSERGARELFSADYRAPLGQGVLRSLNPDNPVSVQDQVLQQRLEQAGLTSENMIVAGAVAVGGAAVRGAEKAFAPVARAVGKAADDILASAPVQAMGNSARKLADDIGEKAGRALDSSAVSIIGTPEGPGLSVERLEKLEEPASLIALRTALEARFARANHGNARPDRFCRSVHPCQRRKRAGRGYCDKRLRRPTGRGHQHRV